MTDLINNVNNIAIFKIEELYAKYQSILDIFKDKQDKLPYFIYVFDIGFNYVKEKHSDLSVDWKTWTMVCLKNLFFKDIIKEESDIAKEIDNFVEHYKKNYDAYINDGIATNEFYRDYSFVFDYSYKRKG